MDKYDKAFADYKRRKRQKRLLTVLCMASVGMGFLLGVAFCIAIVNMFA